MKHLNQHSQNKNQESGFMVQIDKNNHSVKIFSESKMVAKRVSLAIKEQIEKEKKNITTKTTTFKVIGETKIILQEGAITTGHLLVGEYDRLMLSGIPSDWDESYISKIFSENIDDQIVPTHLNIELSFDIGSQTNRAVIIFPNYQSARNAKYMWEENCKLFGEKIKNTRLLTNDVSFYDINNKRNEKQNVTKFNGSNISFQIKWKENAPNKPNSIETLISCLRTCKSKIGRAHV